MRGVCLCYSFSMNWNTLKSSPKIKQISAALQWVGLLVILFLTVNYCIHTPAPGKSVTVLGLAALLMAIRGETGHAEKAVWMLIILVLLFVELRAIDKDRKENESRQVAVQAEEREKFKEMLDQLTGGDSYSVINPFLIPLDGTNSFPLVINVSGKNTLWDVSVLIREGPIKGEGSLSQAIDYLSGKEGKSINLGCVNPGYSVMLSYKLHPSADKVNTYIINVSARNKPTTETLQVRFNKITGMWEYAGKIIREIKPGTGPHNPGTYETLKEIPWTDTTFIEK